MTTLLHNVLDAFQSHPLIVAAVCTGVVGPMLVGRVLEPYKLRSKQLHDDQTETMQLVRKISLAASELRRGRMGRHSRHEAQEVDAELCRQARTTLAELGPRLVDLAHGGTLRGHERHRECLGLIGRAATTHRAWTSERVGASTLLEYSVAMTVLVDPRRGGPLLNARRFRAALRVTTMRGQLAELAQGDNA